MTRCPSLQWIKTKFSYVIGKQAEEFACQYLLNQGLTLVTPNYRCRTGEIDLIMKDADEWVFVEVKYRKSSQYGQAADYFHSSKRKKFESALQQFMHEKKLNPNMIAHRIDLLAIDGKDVQWLKGI